MTDFDPQAIAKRFRDDGLIWAEANCAADMLEETRRTLRSQIALKFMPDAGSVAKSEMMAEATIEYISHVKEMVMTRKEANRSKVQYDADRAYIDLIRSQESTKRAEMGMR